MSRGEARAVTTVAGLVCGLAVAASVSPDLGHVLDVVFGVIYGVGGLVLAGYTLRWWLAGRDGTQRAHGRTARSESHAEPTEPAPEGEGPAESTPDEASRARERPAAVLTPKAAEKRAEHGGTAPGRPNTSPNLDEVLATTRATRKVAAVGTDRVAEAETGGEPS